jgi:hypothetical protein
MRSNNLILYLTMIASIDEVYRVEPKIIQLVFLS